MATKNILSKSQRDTAVKWRTTRGWTLKRIADRYGVSANTIGYHVRKAAKDTK